HHPTTSIRLRRSKSHRRYPTTTRSRLPRPRPARPAPWLLRFTDRGRYRMLARRSWSDAEQSMTDITDNNVVMLNPPTDKAASVDLTDDRLEAIAKDIESLTETATLQVGAKLAEARGIFRYRRDEGGFAGWVKTRLGYSRQTAYNLVHVHERFGGQVSKGLDTLSRSILYLLAAPS